MLTSDFFVQLRSTLDMHIFFERSIERQPHLNMN